MKYVSTIGCLVLAIGVFGGCSLLGDSSMGDRGEVEFSVSGAACGFGCDLSEPVAAGSISDIVLGSEIVDESLTVRVPGSVIAAYRETFTCFPASEESPNDIRDVGADEPCAEGEKRTARREVAVTPSRGEPFVVEVLRGEEVFDSITVDARVVTGFVALDYALDEEVESLSLAAGEEKSFRMDVVDAAGERLVFSDFGGKWEVEDETLATLSDDTVDGLAIAITGVKAGTTSLRLVRDDDSEVAHIDIEVAP